MTPQPLLSVVIPLKDEQEHVALLAAEIAAACAAGGIAWEAIWVDDGSADGTAAALRCLPAPHRVITLERNYGQSAAAMVGYQAARGEWIGTLDGDRQNVPADLLRQLACCRQLQLDLCNGIRLHRHDRWLRRVCSVVANRVRNRITRDAVADVGCSTRVMRRTLVLEVPAFDGMHRFLPTLLRRCGARQAAIPVAHRPRLAGRSKYGIGNRLWSGLKDCFGVRWLGARGLTTQTAVHGFAAATMGDRRALRWLRSRRGRWPDLQGAPTQP